jgi:hypothetical protein
VTAHRDCPGFDWLVARDARCDRCGRAPWDHDHNMVVLGGPHGPLAPRPWRPDTIRQWVDMGHLTVRRANYLLAFHQTNGRTPATR